MSEVLDGYIIVPQWVIDLLRDVLLEEAVFKAP